MPRQLRLELQRPPSFKREDLIVSDANAEAVRAVEAWPGWHGGCLVLVGPGGAGKSHIAATWTERVGAAKPDVPIRTHDLAVFRGRPILVENADAIDGEILFHLINQAGEPGGGLLMTSRTPPSAWPAEVPDLRSRLNALPVAEIGPPDDEILAGALHKFFRERNIRPADDLLPYLLYRMERSIPMAREIVDRLDEAGDAQQRSISRALARDILEAEPDFLGFTDRSLADATLAGDDES